MVNFLFVSVLIPIRNEDHHINNNLSALSRQDYPPGHMEILIADGMSTDNTRLLIHDFSALHPLLKIQILDDNGLIVPTGLNLALRQAKGEIIIRGGPYRECVRLCAISL
jgi:cellulose synthase/poly-beta-1,6-N-acetylglucosamine synthase-like glycosyltransferase